MDAYFSLRKHLDSEKAYYKSAALKHREDLEKKITDIYDTKHDINVNKGFTTSTS